MTIIHTIIYALEQHFGALVAVALGIYLLIAYTRGELKELFAFAKEMLSTDGHASTKNAGYFMGAATICWSFAKITLATCRRIDAPTAPLDPTAIFIAELGVIATLVGVMYLGGKALMAKFGATPPPVDAPPEVQP
jgi:hypothetical protein